MKRPLFVTGLLFLASTLLVSFLSFTLAAVAIAAAALVFFVLLIKNAPRWQLWCVFVVLFGLSFYSLYQILQVVPVQSLAEHNLQMSGEVTQVSISSSSTRMKVDVREVKNSDMKNFSVYLYVYGESPVRVGDSVAGEVYFYSPKDTVFFTGNDYYGGQKVHLLGHSDNIAVTGNKTALTIGIAAKLQALRQDISGMYHSAFDENIASVLDAITLGEKGNLSDDTRTVFNVSGLAHILAVSGLHVTALAGLVFSFLVLIKLPRKLATVFTVSFLVLYCIFTGGSPSALRATIMGVVYFSAGFFHREPDGLSSWGLSGILIVLCFPMVIRAASFQLSFVASLVLLLGSGKINEKLKGVFKTPFFGHNALRYALNVFLSSLLVTVCSFPVMIYHFGVCPLLGPVVNILAIPLVTPILLFGMLMALSGMLGLGAVASVTGVVAGVCTKGLLWVANAFDVPSLCLGLDFFYIQVFFVALFIFTVIFFLKRQLAASVKSALFLSLAVTLTVFLFAGINSAGSVTFIPDSDEKDGHMLMQYGGKTVLVLNHTDKYNIYNAVELLERRNIQSVDVLVFTDNTTKGAATVSFLLRRVQVGTFVTSQSGYYKELLRGQNMEVHATPFQTMDISVGEDVSLEVDVNGEAYLISTRLGPTYVDMVKGEVEPHLTKGAHIVVGTKDFLNRLKSGMIALDSYTQEFVEYTLKE